MKKIIIVLVLFLAASPAFAIDYKKDGNEYSSVKTVKEKSSDLMTPYTWRDSSGDVYPIYISKNNACYIIRVSKKTGKEYRDYLPKEVAADIAQRMNRKTDAK